MAEINQFAKIHPIVTKEGYLLGLDNSGNYTVVTNVKLKNNELGMCIDTKRLVFMYNGQLINVNEYDSIGASKQLTLGFGYGYDMKEALDYSNVNYDNGDGFTVTYNESNNSLMLNGPFSG